jgi:hypothetical protein
VVIVLNRVVVSVVVAVVVIVLLMVEVTGAGVHPANNPDKRMAQAHAINLYDDVFIRLLLVSATYNFADQPAVAFPAIRQGFPYNFFYL